VGWTFPWSICAVRGTHYCLRKIDYPLIWKLLKEEGITHFNAAPTVNTILCAAKEAEKLPRPVKVTVAASPPSAHLFEQMVLSPLSLPCPGKVQNLTLTNPGLPQPHPPPRLRPHRVLRPPHRLLRSPRMGAPPAQTEVCQDGAPRSRVSNIVASPGH
jgi:hypothetical protein